MAEPQFAFPPTETLLAVVQDLSAPLPQRMRSVFYLRTIGGDAAVAALCAALRLPGGTTLFRHEIAYVLGQMEAAGAVPTLVSVLRDAGDDAIVRHECGEALGAIADPATLPVLEEMCASPCAEVAETCQIAAARVRWVLEHGAGSEAAGNMKDNPYESIDPAPSAKKPKKEELPHIQSQLTDQALPLFERYKAMFSLRNNGSSAAVKALCTGFSDPSPLFRHEVAYVLGQLCHTSSIEALKQRILDAGEHEMVRHEAAEALGAIGTSECVAFLDAYKNDSTLMLKESCEVALDAVEYWKNYNSTTEAGAAPVVVAA